ncbi:MAG: DASH complex subunit dam1 [Watsoniomyces obsoletus]|nr:MAG: DASH complex subunit dam1 [Watsoniomyces obsoletus]
MDEEENTDDKLTLSLEAQNALQSFLTERHQHQAQFDELRARSTQDTPNNGDPTTMISMEAFAEDWNASQFWYDDATATTLAEQLLDEANQHSCIAVVSAPSVFVKLKHLMAMRESTQRPTVWLLEFDRRFDIFNEFVFYDFNRPFQLPAHLKGTCDRILCDPPFLSEDCQTKAATTVAWLTRSTTASDRLNADPRLPRFVTCTGQTMAPLLQRLYRRVGLRSTSFRPRHVKGLSNEFRCYANFECPAWTWEDGSEGVP